MKSAKIKFVRKYENYRENWYDVIYYSGRCQTFLETEIPKTVETFVTTATKRTQQYDYTSTRANKWEMIYEA